jgi:multidrug transporter EmrE-like cation transporter
MQIATWAGVVLAALFEVGGDAVIRMGMRSNNFIVMMLGCLVLAAYGLIVNSLGWDFSVTIGIYVGAFASGGVLFGRFLFQENIATTTWIGLAFILTGCLIIHLGLAK